MACEFRLAQDGENNELKVGGKHVCGGEARVGGVIRVVMELRVTRAAASEGDGECDDMGEGV